jgi:hypothetical protein
MEDFKQELIELMEKHKRLNNYINPYLIVGIVNTLEEVYGSGNFDTFQDWAGDMWER